MLSNYPPGAENDPRAPWNEVSVPEKEFEVTVSQTLSKNVTVYTDDYIPEGDYETGRIYADTSETDWKEVYKNQHLTILGLLKILHQYLIDDLKMASLNNSPRKRSLEFTLEECKDWIVDDYEVVY